MQEESPEFDLLRRFWNNPRVERTLLHHDIQSSAAHVRMLAATNIIDRGTADSVLNGLAQIRQELQEGTTYLKPEDVDIHLALERRLGEIKGDEAYVLRIAKSRNDQIATDIRLWLRDETIEAMGWLCSLREQLLSLAERDMEIVMPGYTHMQPAMPILLSHWFLAHEARFRRDFARLSDFYKRLNCLPLGAVALAGTSQPIDRELVASYLGFDSVMDNSLDAVSDRDFIVEFASAASLVGTHLSQLAQDFLLWATQEFGFVRLKREFIFRSRNMPHKRNPELLEILRSSPATINGRLLEFLSQLKALPMGYSQDLQESLPGLMEIADKIKFILELACVLLPGLDFDAKRMHAMASADLTNANNAMDFLVAREIEQSKAAKIVESLVAYCRQRNKYLSDLALSEWQQFSPAFDNEIYKLVTIEESVGSLSSYGGTSVAQVAPALARAREILEGDRLRVPGRLSEYLQAGI